MFVSVTCALPKIFMVYAMKFEIRGRRR